MPKNGVPEMPEIEEKAAISLYSRTDLLRVLGEYYYEALPRSGYQEEHFYTNIRIILCMLCCSFGAYAQFGTKFPQDRQTLMACVLAYFGVSIVLAIMDCYLMSAAVMCFKIGDQSVFLDVNLPAFSDKLNIALRSGSRKESIDAEAG